jgi:hypothetical protein
MFIYLVLSIGGTSMGPWAGPPVSIAAGVRLQPAQDGVPLPYATYPVVFAPRTGTDLQGCTNDFL